MDDGWRKIFLFCFVVYVVVGCVGGVLCWYSVVGRMWWEVVVNLSFCGYWCV